MGKNLVKFSVDHPKWIMGIIFLFVFIAAIQFPKITIDTDPENMLSEDAFVRVFHNEVKKRFSLHDFIVLGIVNERHTEGVFNPDTMGKIFNITKEIKKIEGVIGYDLMSPSTIDNIRQAGEGAVKFEWLMAKPPQTMEEALDIRDEAKDNPMLNGTLVSEDGKAIAVYVPIRKKDISYRVSQEIKSIVSKLEGDEQYHITGLPVAEDTFGVEMFKQMALSAPMAGLLIFVIMWYFFRKVTLIISPMIVAMFSITYSMGAMIGMGYTVHIMSSMIPIFLMPISVVDSVHILSQFFDQYQKNNDRRTTILFVMDDLFQPMLYTSLTTAVGFASLAFTPIPPVKIFGLFIASGVMAAWLLSMTFIPAYIMLMKESGFKNFGIAGIKKKGNGLLPGLLIWLGRFSYGKWKILLISTTVILIISGIGIRKIQINDNPVKWFEYDHPVRVADRVLNSHFGGTYTAYLTLKEEMDEDSFTARVAGALERFVSFSKNEGIDLRVVSMVQKKIIQKQKEYSDAKAYEINKLFYDLLKFAEGMTNKTEGKLLDSWEIVIDFTEDESLKAQTFKQAELLRYVEDLQGTLKKTGIVGKSTSLADIVKKVHYELRGGDKKYNLIPNTSPAIGQTLISFQNSHDPDDLWHFVTQDYLQANIWVQLTSGDNKDMQKVIDDVKGFLKRNTPPVNLKVGWGGLTYLNVIWQDEMVKGMLKSLLGSFIIVFAMMVFLYRSFLWGFLAMLPLSVTIIFIYGLIGFAGKDYDMPIAVLSSLTLGLSIDFAIHFLEKVRTLYKETGTLAGAIEKLFLEPARAISRNVVIIAIGFLPLLTATLVPYKTVGFFMFTIMVVSGVGTLLILPAIITGLSGILFKNERS